MNEPVLLGAVRLSAKESTREKEALYYFVDSGLPGIDFNREILKPGQVEQYPDGALIIRADDDFWIVAVLPLQHESLTLQEVVEILWPGYAKDAQYTPDSDTPERALYEMTCYSESERVRADFFQKAYDRVKDENERLRAARPAPRERYSPRAYTSNNYFIRQYECLLIATAHAFVPRPEDHLKGLCAHCNLTSSDRAHSREWIARRAERDADPSASSPYPQFLCEFEE